MRQERRWDQVGLALQVIAPICTKYDDDGIDLYFLNKVDKESHHNIREAKQVNSIFSGAEPFGATPTGERLNSILIPYLDNVKKRGAQKVKKLNIIVITDGQPTDGEDLKANIVAAAKTLDSLKAPLTQLGIQFFQVGSDALATKALKKLDDELSEIENIRDMVDTVLDTTNGDLTAAIILKALLGAIDRRQDAKST